MSGHPAGKQFAEPASSNGHQRQAEGVRNAVILAGGRGTRLAPYTSILPKPLMPIGERSILETVVDQLAHHGFTNLTFCVGYLSHLIRAVFDARSHPGVAITYVQEESALGTAAPLRLVERPDDSFVLMNGDVLTTLDYRDLVRSHQEAGNVLTVATHKRRIRIDYGVVRLDEQSNGGLRAVEGWEEKPEVVSSVSMGIYVLEPAAIEFIPPEGYFDFPDLVQALLAAGERVGAYQFDGLWFDIGRQDDYEQAVSTWLSNASPNGDNGADATLRHYHAANGDDPSSVVPD